MAKTTTTAVMEYQVKACFICDKKHLKHTKNAEMNSVAANSLATTLTNVFTFEQRSYHGELITGTSAAGRIKQLQFGTNSIDKQNRIATLKNQLKMSDYCYQCVQNIRSVSEILKKIQILEQEVIDFKDGMVKQFIEFTTSTHQEEEEEVEEPNIIDNDLLRLLRTEVIELNFAGFQEPKFQRSLVEKEDKPPTALSLNSNNQSKLQEQSTMLSVPIVPKDLRINLNRIKEIPVPLLSKYGMKSKSKKARLSNIATVAESFIKEEDQQTDNNEEFEVKSEVEYFHEDFSLDNTSDIDIDSANKINEADPNFDQPSNSPKQSSIITVQAKDATQESKTVSGDKAKAEIKLFTCQVKDCQFSTSLKRYLACHNRKQHLELSNISCDMCSSKYTTYSSLHWHKRTAHNYTKSMCRRCGEEFSTDKELASHSSVHQNKQPNRLLPCLKCTYLAPSIDLFRQHLQRHDPLYKEQFKTGHCVYEDCKFSSQVQKNLKDHIWQEHSKLSKVHSCDICSTEYPTLMALKFHKFKAHNIQDSTCTKCGEIVPPELLLRHRRIVHPSKPTKKYPCPKCSYTAFSTTYLKEHMEKHNPNPSRNYICQYCGLGFRTPKRLKYHQGSKHIDLNLQDPDLYKCKVCDQVFGTPPVLQIHMKEVHFQDQCEFFCDKCGKAFTTINRLKTHQLSINKFPCTHIKRKSRGPRQPRDKSKMPRPRRRNGPKSDDGECECEICHTKFKNARLLQRHMQKHTGQFQFICETCGKGFTNSGSLKMHNKMHISVLSHFCEICGKGFPIKLYLQSHMRSHKNTEDRLQRQRTKYRLKAKQNKTQSRQITTESELSD